MTFHKRCAFVFVVSLAAGLFVVQQRLPHPERLSDLAQVLFAARAWSSGSNPYEAVRAWGAWPFPLLYPFTAILAALPLTIVPTWAGEALFAAGGAGLLAWGLTGDKSWTPRLLVFVSAPFIHAIVLDQWSPLLTGAALIPWAGFVLACKPNIGLALFAAFPGWRAAASAATLTAVSLAIWPGWPVEWRTALTGAPNSLSLVALPGGVLLLFAALRWRTHEGRLLLALAVVPHTTLPYEAVPLFLIPRTWTEAWILWTGTAIALIGHVHAGPYPSQLAWVRAGGLWLLYCAYLPSLLMILMRGRGFALWTKMGHGETSSRSATAAAAEEAAQRQNRSSLVLPCRDGPSGTNTGGV